MPGCCLGLTAFSLILAVAVFMGGPDAHRARCAGGGSDASWNPYTRPARGSDTAAVCTSSYVTMRDGVKIAVDVCLPSDLAPGERLPAIVHQTRCVAPTPPHHPAPCGRRLARPPAGAGHWIPPLLRTVCREQAWLRWLALACASRCAHGWLRCLTATTLAPQIPRAWLRPRA